MDGNLTTGVGLRQSPEGWTLVGPPEERHNLVMAEPTGAKKQIARNRKAFHNYEVLEQVEAGLVLKGTEVKSLREGNVSFNDAHARNKEGEIWLVDMHISSYKNASWSNHAPTRPRKLLLHKREIKRIRDKQERQGLTLVPLDLYFRRGFAKITLGICRGRKQHDKRQVMRARQDAKTMARAMKERNH
jgi:SsrA-binding protein